jgi:hypothetical protein
MKKHPNEQTRTPMGFPTAPVQLARPWPVNFPAIDGRMLQAGLIIMAGFWVFWPALHGDWYGDDWFLITNNLDLRSFSGLGKVWSATPQGDYWPVTSTVLWLQWHLWGAQPLPYHLLNLGLHLTDAFLVWRLLNKLGLRSGWAGGLLFVIHPLAVESVAWASEIKNNLSLLFFLLSLEAHIDCDQGRPSGYLRSLIYYVAAMLSKTSVVMLPAVILLYNWWKRGRITRQEVKQTIPYFVIAAALGLATYHIQATFMAADPMVDGRGVVARMSGAGVAVFFYLGKFLVPIGLVPIYPRWQIEPPSFSQMATVPLLVALLFWFWIRRKGWGRHALLGLGFFLLNLLPVLGLVRMGYLHISWVADHLAYIPMIGLIGLGVAGLEAVHRQISVPWRPLLTGALAALGGLLAWTSHGEAEHWINSETLLAYNVKYNPDNWLLHWNLGNAAYANDHFQLATSEYQAALRLNPNSATIHYSLGNTYLLFFPNDFDQALFHAEEAVRLEPGLTAAQYNLQTALALKRYVAAQQANIAEAVARTDLGNDFSKIPLRSPEAINQYEIALRINPNYAPAHYGLALILSDIPSRKPEAIRHLEEALRSKPDFQPARRMLEQLQGTRQK